MQGDFEKKVQAKMEELHMNPSAPLWEKIELQIRPEKRRRRVIAWLLFAVLLMIGGPWLWMQQKQQSLPAVSRSGPVTNSLPEKKTPFGNPTQNGASANLEQHKQKATPVPPHNLIFETANALHANHAREQKSRTAAIKRNAAALPAEGQPSGSATATTRSAVDNRENEAALQKKTAAETAQPKQQATSTRVIVNDTITSNETAAEKMPVPADTVPLRKKIAAVNKKWTKQIAVQAGWSSASSIVVNAYPAAFASSNPNIRISGNNSPAAITKGISFAVGFGMSKALGKRLQLTAGLQYAFYSTHTKVGDYRRIDTSLAYANNVSIDGFYSNNNGNNYTSRFHVLEVPVSLSYRPFSTLPLLLSVGASYGRVLNTNNLTYNRAYNIYYIDKNNNNGNYLNLVAGLQYGILQQKNWNVCVGPAVQYNLASLQKETSGTKPHLFFTGLKSTVNF